MLTPDQSVRLGEFRRRCNAVRISTASVDRQSGEQGVEFAYRAAGLGRPQIIWCNGPIELARDWLQARQRTAIGPSVRAAVIDDAKSLAQHAVSRDQNSAVISAVPTLAERASSTAVSMAVKQAVARDQRWAWSGLTRLLLSTLSSLARFKNPAREWLTFERSGCGVDELAWLDGYQFLHDVFGLKATEGLRGLWLIGGNTGWILPHENVCWLADRANLIKLDLSGRLHSASGPALTYRDGWAYHAWKGIEVPAGLIERPDAITLDAINQESDIFRRRCMIEIMTPQRFVMLGGAERVSQDQAGVLWRKSWALGEPWAAVEVENGTTEADGTRRHYFLQVPGDIRSPRAAVAWTYGISEEQYTGLKMRT